MAEIKVGEKCTTPGGNGLCMDNYIIKLLVCYKQYDKISVYWIFHTWNGSSMYFVVGLRPYSSVKRAQYMVNFFTYILQ